MQITKVLSLYLLMSLMALSGCETVPAKKPLKIDAGTILVLSVEAMHKELKDAAAPAYKQLIKKIGKKGFRIVPLTPTTYQQLREMALVQSGSVYDPQVGQFVPLDRAAYLKAIIDISRNRFPHDVVLIPEVILRNTAVVGDEMSWDGIKKEISFVDPPETIYDLPRNAKGLSLRLAAYTRNGARLFYKFNGISLPYLLRYSEGKFSLELKEKFFTDKELKKGVELALKPFFAQVHYKNGK